MRAATFEKRAGTGASPNFYWQRALCSNAACLSDVHRCMHRRRRSIAEAWCEDQAPMVLPHFGLLPGSARLCPAIGGGYFRYFDINMGVKCKISQISQNIKFL